MQKLSIKLLEWYDIHHRLLPWRVTPCQQKQGIRADPYRIWLSEIMLQQTIVETVKPYFHRFIQKWPTITALSQASEEDILKEWAGLGYYSRARNLKACADAIMSNYHGIFPDKPELLRNLPGIGDYTANALASIAFNIPAPVVDGNVERIICRLFAIKTKLPQARKAIRHHIQILTPRFRAGDFAQSMMDLGAAICRPRHPKCPICPLSLFCLARKEGDPQKFPYKQEKIIKPVRSGVAFVALSEKKRVFLQKRPAKGLLANMSEVPNSFALEGSKSDLSSAPFPDFWNLSQWHHYGDICHIFTHFKLSLAVYRADNLPEIHHDNGQWVALEELGIQAIPTMVKKILSKALSDLIKL